MKKILMCFAVFAAVVSFAAEGFKLDYNTTDKAVIKSYADALAAGNVPADKVDHVTRMVKVLEALADVDNTVSYADLKSKIFDAVKDLPMKNGKKVEGITATLSAVFVNIKRFQTPALCQAYVDDLMVKRNSKNKQRLVTWAISRAIKLKGLTTQQYIWLFENGMKDSTSATMAMSIFTAFEKESAQMPSSVVLDVCKKVKRAIYSRISDDAWKPVLVKLELLIQSLQ